MVHRVSRGQSMCKIGAKSNNPRVSYWQFSKLLQRDFKLYSSEGDGPNCTTFRDVRAPSSLHQIRLFGTDALLRLKTSVLKEEEWCRRSTPNFTLFDPLWKLAEGWERKLSCRGSNISCHLACGVYLMVGEQLSAELWETYQIITGVTSRCDLNFWPTDL